ncbi:MAG: hypothetical protein Q8R82_06555 [Hyphomonadaceae bacterium]|nr:hypothetical protein [Hyphomonadaceae bacterium]
MKSSSLIALLFAGAALVAAPAIAGTSLSKGKKVCESAARAQTPAPKSVRTDDDKTRSSDTTLIYTLKVKNADDTVGNVTCKVDRTTDAPTLTPAS